MLHAFNCFGKFGETKSASSDSKEQPGSRVYVGDPDFENKAADLIETARQFLMRQVHGASLGSFFDGVQHLGVQFRRPHRRLPASRRSCIGPVVPCCRNRSFQRTIIGAPVSS